MRDLRDKQANKFSDNRNPFLSEQSGQGRFFFFFFFSNTRFPFSFTEFASLVLFSLLSMQNIMSPLSFMLFCSVLFFPHSVGNVQQIEGTAWIQKVTILVLVGRFLMKVFDLAARGDVETLLHWSHCFRLGKNSWKMLSHIQRRGTGSTRGHTEPPNNDPPLSISVVPAGHNTS